MISTFSKDSSSTIDNAEGLRFSRVLVGPLVSLWVGRPGLDPGTLGSVGGEVRTFGPNRSLAEKARRLMDIAGPGGLASGHGE